MKKFVVRLWVDIVVEAEDRDSAKKVADGYPVEVGDAEIYEIQTAQVWDKESDQ